MPCDDMTGQYEAILMHRGNPALSVEEQDAPQTGDHMGDADIQGL